MTRPSALSFEINTRPRLAKSVGVSIAVHLLLALSFMLVGHTSEQAEVLTEISWMEPNPPEEPVVKQVKVTPAAVAPSRLPERETEPTPRPETMLPARFDIDGRVAALTRNPVRRREPALDRMTPAAPRTATLAPQAGSTQPAAELVRRETGPSRPVELRRSPVRQPAPRLTLPDTPAPVAQPVLTDEIESTAERSLAGASLLGPVAERELSSYVKPDYPEWAKREGAEASVTIYFLVRPDGRVKTNVQIQKTSGFEDFDRNAATALLAWRFGPLPDGVTGDQWGLVTFHYRLTDPAAGP